ncbi:hypothetical protein ACGFX4_23640 [Kitasatospora sp. NPDC048365]|uniref:hypothetical protein n=1 Tax=Kitasatospora sp. NPDC048365 TaxID=3364050 RepID=UPI003714F05C
MWPHNSSDPTFQYNTVGSSKPSTFDATAWDCDISVTGTCSTDVVLRCNVALDDCRMVETSGKPGTHYICNNTFHCPSRPIVDTIGNDKRMVNTIFVAPAGSSWTTVSGSVFDHNLFFGGTAVPTGATDSVTADPRLTGDATGAGFRLRSGSPALGAGTAVAGNGGTDFFGNPVSAGGAPNIGAYNGAGADEALPIARLYNEIGVTRDDNATADDHASATNSGRTFSGNALEAAGLVPGQPFTTGGVTFTWHPGRYGTPDNVHATGQKVAVSGSGSTLGILGFATGSAPAGQGTLTFSDGSSQPFTLALTDWWNTTPSGGNTLAAQVSYQNQHSTPYNASSTPPYNHTATLRLAKVGLPAGKQLTSVTLPAGSATAGSALHVFDLAPAP